MVGRNAALAGLVFNIVGAQACCKILAGHLSAGMWKAPTIAGNGNGVISKLEFQSMDATPEFVLNGQARRLETEICVARLLEELGYAGKRVAVEMDGEIVPKSRHAETMVRAGNRIEIVVAVGGG